MSVRILTFSSLYPSSIRPRHGIFVEQRLRQLLAAGGVECKVVAPVPWLPRAAAFGRYADYATVPAEEHRNGIEVLHPRYPLLPKVGMTLAPLLLALAMLPVLRRIIRQGFNFDLIDAHYFYPDGVAATLLGRWLHKPVVITARGSDVNVLPDYYLPRRMIQWAARHCAAIITVSQALKHRLELLGVASQHITVLRNGVDLELFQPVAQQQARLHLALANRLTLLSVGNLLEGKGHHRVIEALVSFPDAQLIIVGEGGYAATLRQLAEKLDVTDRVIFAGNVAQQQLKFYYSAADLLVLASRSEGMPNVLLEALACGTRVLASRVGGVPEIVTAVAAGRVLEDSTATGLATALHSLLAEPVDRVATRSHAARFGWDTTTQGQLSLFTRVMQHAAAGDPARYRSTG